MAGSVTRLRKAFQARLRAVGGPDLDSQQRPEEGPELGPECGVSIAARAVKALKEFPQDDLHVLFMLKNSPDLGPATPSDAKNFDENSGWGKRGSTFVDDEMKGRNTYFAKGMVGTMVLSKGFVIEAINEHDFITELPEVLKLGQ